MKNYLLNTILESFILYIVVLGSFAILEPNVTNALSTTATVSQTVYTEIAFATPASDIVLSPNIDTSLGGVASGQTQVVVRTNDHLGYSMTITASSSLGMIGVASTTHSIPSYVSAVAGVPDFTFTTPSNKAYFGYTAEASSTSDLATAFKDNAGVCNAVGGIDTADSCWIGVDTTPYTVINRTSETLLSGATTTLKFRVAITANPVPALPDDSYVATTTLTATAN